jgi:translation initiation factor 4E
MASELRQGCDYSLFKKGIRPMWEDDANKRGGRWLINLTKNQRGNELDKYWLEIVSMHSCFPCANQPTKSLVVQHC